MSKDYTYYTYNQDGDIVKKSVHDTKGDGLLMAMDNIINQYGSFDNAPTPVLNQFRNKYWKRAPSRHRVHNRIVLPKSIYNGVGATAAYQPIPADEEHEMTMTMVDNTRPAIATSSLKYYYCWLDLLQGYSKRDVLKYRHMSNQNFIRHGKDIYQVYYTYTNLFSGREYTATTITGVINKVKKTKDKGPTSHDQWNRAWKCEDHNFYLRHKLYGHIGKYAVLQSVKLHPNAKEKFLELLEDEMKDQYELEAFIGKYIGSKGAFL